MQKKILSYYEFYSKIYLSDGFKTIHTPLDYRWGSNGTLLVKSFHLIGSFLITQNRKYKEIALSQLNYILGLNINNISFVSGLDQNMLEIYTVHH